jgi:hypothetical protein
MRTIIAISCLLFAAAAWRLAPHSASGFAAAQTSHPATIGAAAAAQTPHVQPVSASVPSTTKLVTIPELRPIAPPGTEIYTAKRGDAIPSIAHRYLGRTSYMTSSELADAIRAVNSKSGSSNILKANENILIPGILSAPIVEKTIPIPKDFEVRAVYLTGIMAGSDHGLRIIRQWRAVGGNAVVFDIKDSDGSVSIPFEHPLVGKHTIYIHDLPKFIHFVHQQNMHAIARIAVFRDERLVKDHPELAVQSRKNHTAWRENGKLVWTDPSQPKVQDYNIALAKYAALQGVDEIQFDYVRFPAEGDQKDAAFVFQKGQAQTSVPAESTSAETDVGSGCPTSASVDPASNSSSNTAANVAADSAPKGQNSAASSLPRASEASRGGASRGKDGQKAQAPKLRKNGCNVPRGPQRSNVITAFLKKAYAEIHPTGALFSLDVFGVMAWQRQVDLSHTGQDIVQMARYCDVLSPMIYPSHFFGMDNIPHPGDEPAHFIGESMDRFGLITRGSGVVIRPWLQAFHWRTKTYSPEYIKIQVETARDRGGIGFLFWNAGNDYSKPFVAMPEMKAENYKPAPNSPNNDSKDGGNPAANSPANPPASPKDAPGTKDGAKDKYRFFRGDELPAPAVQAALTPAN